MQVKFLLLLWKHIVLKKSTTVGVLMYMLDTTAAKKGTTLLKGSKERRDVRDWLEECGHESTEKLYEQSPF